MLTVRGASKRYGDTLALDRVDLQVATGEILAVVGPSGSGKSTLLRVVAGLETLDEGSIWWDQEEVTNSPVHRRRFGLMFQDYALFPHRTVAQNVAFGLRMDSASESEVAGRVSEVLGWVGLEGFGHRPIDGLSGGEQQRVALARSLAPAPRLLMLDEPLGSLDRTLRERLMVEMREVLAGHGITSLYVTHDQEEALVVADRVAVLRAGRVVQMGEPSDIWARPADEWTARFLGLDNIVAAAISDGIAATPLGPVPVDSAAEGEYRLLFLPGALTLDPNGPVAGEVIARTFRGETHRLEISLGDQTRMTVEVMAGLPVPDTGDRVHLRIDPARVVILD